MTFSSVRNVATERFNEVLMNLNHIESLEPDVGLPVGSDVKMMKGLFFVHLYGAMEKTMTEAVQLLLLKIKHLEPRNEHVTLVFNVVSMSRKWKSMKDSGYKDAIPKMTSFFQSITAKEYLGFDESFFCDVLQNVWAKTIMEIVSALGICSFNLGVSDSALIDEIVEKRNAVAHGRESPLSAGETYRCADLRRKLVNLQAITLKFIDCLESYFENREFILDNDRMHYIK